MTHLNKRREIHRAVDVEKTMRFILETQARLEAKAARHDEQLQKIRAAIAFLTGQVSAVTDSPDPPKLTQQEVARRGGIARAKKLSREQRQEIASHAGKMAATKRRVRKAKLELETHTKQRPNRLIDVVDKLIAHNGRTRK